MPGLARDFHVVAVDQRGMGLSAGLVTIPGIGQRTAEVIVAEADGDIVEFKP
jgi:pimeloyl-ACP methyl ester carboxylesterase